MQYKIYMLSALSTPRWTLIETLSIKGHLVLKSTVHLEEEREKVVEDVPIVFQMVAFWQAVVVKKKTCLP